MRNNWKQFHEEIIEYREWIQIGYEPIKNGFGKITDKWKELPKK